LTHFRPVSKKLEIKKFLWGDLGTSPPQLFSRGGPLPHGIGDCEINGCNKPMDDGTFTMRLVFSNNVGDMETLGVIIKCSMGLEDINQAAFSFTL